MAPSVRTVVTSDGSTTVVQTETGWSYRSLFGAALESRWVFVEGTRVFHRGLSRPRILELGLGAAGNLVETLRARPAGVELVYCAVDRAPLPLAAMDRGEDPAARLARGLVAGATRDGIAEAQGVRFELRVGEFGTLEERAAFDAVYFDPFGPSEQPDSWSIANFTVARRALAPGGRLATYASAGWVRRNMAAAGLHVATTAGPPSKREISLAAVDPSALLPLRIRNEARA